MARRLDVIIASGDGQGILAHDAVPLLGENRELARAAQGQVGFRENHAVHPVFGDVFSGEGVFTALGQGDEHLIGGFHLNGRAGFLVDGDTAEHKLHLVLVPDLHGDLTVFDFSGEDEYSGVIDCHRLAGQLDAFCPGQIRLLGQVTIRKERILFCSCIADEGGENQSKGDQQRKMFFHKCFLLDYSPEFSVSWQDRLISRFPFRHRSSSSISFSRRRSRITMS